MAESLSAVLSLRSKYPACQFKAFDIWSEYLCFHIFITVIKCGTEMDGVCTTSCMAYKSMLEFPVNLVCMFFWTVGAEDLEKAPQGGEHATSTWRIEPEGLATVLIATPLFCGHTGPSGAGGGGVICNFLGGWNNHCCSLGSFSHRTLHSSDRLTQYPACNPL